MAAPVEVEDRPGRLQVGADPKRRDAIGVDGLDLGPFRRRELGVEGLDRRAALGEGIPGRWRRTPAPSLSEAEGELAAHRLGRGDGLIDALEQAVGALEQRRARQRELDPVGRAAQQVAPDQLLE